MDVQYDLNKFFNSAVEHAVAERVKLLETEYVAKVGALKQTIQNEKDDQSRLRELYKDKVAMSKALGESVATEREKTLHERELYAADLATFEDKFATIERDCRGQLEEQAERHGKSVAKLKKDLESERELRKRTEDLELEVRGQFEDIALRCRALEADLNCEHQELLHERELREAAESELEKLRDRVRLAIGDNERGPDQEDEPNILETPAPVTAEQDKRSHEDAEDGGESPAKRVKLEDGEIDEEQETGDDDLDRTVRRADHEVLGFEDRAADPCGPCVLSGDTATCSTHIACGRCLGNKRNGASQ